MKLFDYIFFRLAKFFYKRDGRGARRAIAIVSIIQCLLFGELATIGLRSFYSFAEIATFRFGIRPGYIGVVVAFTLMAINFFHYKGKYWKLSEKWRDLGTPGQRMFYGWLVVLSICFPFIVLILMGTIFGQHNAKQ